MFYKFANFNLCLNATMLNLPFLKFLSFFFFLHQFFTKIIHYIQLKLKPKCLKLILVPYSRSFFDLHRFAISVCSSEEFQIQHIVITISNFLMWKMCTHLHETEATHLNGLFITRKLPPLTCKVNLTFGDLWPYMGVITKICPQILRAWVPLSSGHVSAQYLKSMTKGSTVHSHIQTYS